MMAEGLFRQAIDSLEKQPVSPYLPINLLKSKQLYGEMLVVMQKRENEGERLLKEAISGISEKNEWWSKMIRCV